jgi:hypothetical protein
MIGSAAPRRVLGRLERLALAVERLGEAGPPDALTAEPLAELTAPALGQGVLAAVLDRLSAGGEPVRLARPRPLHRRAGARPPTSRAPFGVEPLLEPEAAAGGGTRAGSGSRASAHRRDAARAIAGAADRTTDPASPVAATRVSLEEPGMLARVAARVPGGLAAIATPIAPQWAADEPGAATAQSTVLDDLLAARRLRTEPEPRTPSGPGGREPRRPWIELPSWRDREPEEAPVASLRRAAGGLEGAGSSHRDQAEPVPAQLPSWTSEREVAEGAEPGSRGLAELVRRWEGGREPGDPAEAGGGRLPREPDSDETVAGQGAEEALARALERLLAGELRRSGIELEAG